MSLRQRNQTPSQETQSSERPYNIIPVDTLLADHPSLRFPEVRATIAALRDVGNLSLPPEVRQWEPHMDLLDWLAAFFGFQRDNVRNQREHLVLHLANTQMRQSDNIDSLDPVVLRRFRRKLLSNYSTWCSFVHKRSKVKLGHDSGSNTDHQRRQLLYVSLYLLIWGESANLRFVPECICFIFHHLAMELTRILDDHIDKYTGKPFLPSVSGENAYLNKIVKPIYNTISGEVDNSKNGTAPHSAWRNYDDINEYFWSKRCFDKLKWPIDLNSNFLVADNRGGKWIGKTGFVEQRSFWNLFRSFDKLWIMLILFFQVGVIVAWDEKDYVWQSFNSEDVRVKCLSAFITWSALRLLRSILDVRMQIRIVSRETLGPGVRMILKIGVATSWIFIFMFCYWKMWTQRNVDNKWSAKANDWVTRYCQAAAVYLIPECLAIVLFLLPWVRNFIEQTDWRIFYALSWWFQSRIYVGRGLREGLVDNIKYTIFWIVVLSTKFCFSYYLQIKPMVEPTHALINKKNVKYEWDQIFKNNIVAVGLLWLPVVLIYLMDIQIWYSIYSSFVGVGVGLFQHLGEIRNMQQLKWRFQFFASAVQFNLMPREHVLNARVNLMTKIQDGINRLKLRYGLGRPFKKLESNEAEATKFELMWNEIIVTFREEDILSDHEVELLELPKNTWDIRVIRWPCFLLCNELLLALSQANELVDAPDKWLWYKIRKHDYRRYAVIESYDSTKHLLLQIVKGNTEEHSIITALFHEIDTAIQSEKLTKKFKLTALPKIHAKLIALLNLITNPKKDISKMVNTLQVLYEVAVRDFHREKRNTDQLREDGLAPRKELSSEGLLFENAIELPDTNNDTFYSQARRLHTLLTSRDSMQNVPKNHEARRRLAFFSNSLFMNMPYAPQVEKMRAFSVLTPYYNEEVLYSKENLRTENEDGITTLYYLQTIYDDEWENFLQRMKREGLVNTNEIWTTKVRDLRLWASYRGQTLARTVRGMMYYSRALKMLAFLDSASEMDIGEGSRELYTMKHCSSSNSLTLEKSLSTGSFSRADDVIKSSFRGHEYGTALMKYTYVIACQIYGTQKAKKDPRAEDILYLMKNNEALRVAYVDEVPRGRDDMEYYSVLVKYDQQLKKEVEIYRVKLPGPLKLGEGKPENQNHAFIFTRGDAVQTIDMNQDNYFEEALKMRNLLEEYKHYYGIRKPTILGVREHIFTASVSSLAWFMSAQETSFVTLGQRVLADPLKVRMHYGHPDVFDRFWFLTRGGISKASRVINISEDIFAGFNCTLRGGNVTHHEYIQVGKGRDVGLNQVSMFEAKVASGNGEQVLSRDVYRLGHRLDFFRMLSFFYTTVGFYMNSLIIIFTVYSFLWGRLYLALSGVEKALKDDVANNTAFGTILNQQFLLQLGVFTALPMIVENSLELGFLSAIWEFFTMQLQLSSVFFTFSMGTRSHYFGRTILHGGAKYRATGRGFVVEHKSFAENYRLFARSHFIKAIELGLILIIYAAYGAVAKDTFVYIVLTISSWFMVVSWIMAPFVFNPSAFDWLKLVYDFDDFMNWIWFRGSVFAKSEQSWERWWYEEQDHLKTTGFWGKVLEVILDLRFFFFQYGIVYQLGISSGSHSIIVYLFSWVYAVVVLAVYCAVRYAQETYAEKEHIYYRLCQLQIIIVVILLIVVLLQFTEFEFVDVFRSMLALIPTGWGIILIAQVFRPSLENTQIWRIVVSLARAYDIMFGVIVMTPVAVLSWLPGFQAMQTRILFNDAFSRGLQIFKIVTGKKPRVDL